MKTLRFPDGTKKALKLTKVPKNLEEFRQDFISLSFLEEKKKFDTGFFPCTVNDCRGKGTFYDPNDPPDPIEGNKLRNRVKCPKCHGTGRGERREFTALYKKAKAAAQTKVRAEVEKAKATQSALDKLTAEEWRLLQTTHWITLDSPNYTTVPH